MMSQILSSVQEPPKPTFDAWGIWPGFLTIVIFVFAVLILLAVLSRKRPSTTATISTIFRLSVADFTFFFLAMIGGFLIGLVSTSAVSVGLAFITGAIALLVSVVIDLGAKLLVRIWHR